MATTRIQRLYFQWFVPSHSKMKNEFSIPDTGDVALAALGAEAVGGS
jgi:hypothetical protein